MIAAATTSGAEGLSPLPAPTLPRGGQAVLGLGESVKVDPFTGSCNVSIPLGVSAGRGASAVNLSLTHSGGGSRSPYGNGWQLPVSQIGRSGRDGVPTYTPADTFTHDGQDLVPVRVPGPGGEQEYDEPAVVDGVNVRVRRFHARNFEGDRVEQIVLPDDSTYWRVWSHDNVVSRYGASDDSRIYDPTDRQRVYEWLLDEVRDDLGNVAVYEYKRENTDEVVPSMHEASRLGAGAPAPAGRHLKRIRYVNGQPDDAGSTQVLITFDYGEHDESDTEVRAWPVRLDPYSNCSAGFEVRTWRLLRRVLVFHEFAELQPGPSPRLIRAFNLGHEESAVDSRLISVTQVGYEWTGAAYTSLALPPVEIEYCDSAPADEVRSVEMQEVRDGHQQRWVDLEGDGLPGVLWCGVGGWWYQRPAGEARLLPPRAVEVPQPSRSGADPTFEDIDGSGRLSAVGAIPGVHGTTQRAIRGGWTPWQPFASNAVNDDRAPEKLDLDLDGRSDLVRFGPSEVRWNRGLGRRGHERARTVRQPGPRVPTNDASGQWFRADMNGDGVTDLVRITEGSVEYWPGVGRGEFGTAVTMSNPPRLAEVGGFEPERVRLVALDGRGGSDLVYLGKDAVYAWTNQAGNGFSERRTIAPLPRMRLGMDELHVVDLLGKATPCLVLTSSHAPTGYLDLNVGFGSRHHVRAVTNNFGRRLTLTYSTSTQFALADRREGRPWRTRLSSPIVVVSTLADRDEIADSEAVTTYSYRDGYFDPDEREFRGFARVDVTESGGASMVTRMWFHVGTHFDQLEGAWTGDTATMPLRGSAIEGVVGGEEHVEALRSLAGRSLRAETYDGISPVPITVAEDRWRAVRMQGRKGARPAVFRVEPLESLESTYERDAGDPRVSHDLTLSTDEFGTVLSAASVAYARRIPQQAEQMQPRIAFSTTEVVNTDTPAVYRVGTVIGQREYDVTGVPVPNSGRYDVANFAGTLGALAEWSLEQVGLPGAGKRLTSETRLEYWDDTLAAPLTHGAVGQRALVRRTLRLAVTPGLVADLYGGVVNATALVAAGYDNIGGSWYADSGVTTYDPSVMYQPTTWSFFGNTATATYDGYGLLVVGSQASTTAPLDLNAATITNDYRVLAPSSVTDAQGTVSRVDFDELGRVVSSWSTAPDGSGDPAGLPGITHSYDTGSWLAGTGPTWSQTDTRETAADASSRWRRQRLFTDGSGRVVMTKSLAPPGLAIASDGNGAAVVIDTSPAPRWIASGRTVFNGRGLPVEQYEPYYSATVDYEDSDALVKHAVTDRRSYDALGRVVRLDHPDGTFERWEFEAWRELHYDRNDTVQLSSWLASRRQPGTPGAESRAASLAITHADTPSVSGTDPMGRLVRTGGDLGSGKFMETVRHLDLDGRTVRVDDALGRVTARQVYDGLGRVVETWSADAGRQRVFVASDGLPVMQWGANGDLIRCGYDGLRRRTHLYVTDAEGLVERLAEFCVYGEWHAQAQAHFLVGRIHRRYDEAGLSLVEKHDLAGNVVQGSRRILATAVAETRPDWSPLAGLPLSAMDAQAAGLLDIQAFAAGSMYNALGQPVRQEMPDGTVLQLTYDMTGLLHRLRVTPAGGSAFDALVGVEHDARQRRTKVEYGNGVTTRYSYAGEDNRLRDALTTGPAGTLQDLRYTYDPVGNVVQVDDAATQQIFYAGTVATGTRTYTYDPMYRLLTATGREHASLGVQPDHNEPQIRPVPHPHDAAAIRPYKQTFEYDEVGNLRRLVHSAGSGSFTREHSYDAASNRLLAHSQPGDSPNGPYSATFDYDGAGRVTRMLNLAHLSWDHAGLLRTANLGGGGTVTFHTDGTGHRVRKIWQRSGGLREERIYLGDFEIFRRYLNGTLVFERTTSHIRDVGARVALIERVTVDSSSPVPGDPVIRYNHGDHLGSSVVETDAAGAVLTYEEFHPYGSTAVWLARNTTTLSRKRYRYTGKEKDEETGLYFHGARYYAPWLARWVAPDPVGLLDGSNRYAYVNSNPVRLFDPDGLSGADMEQMWFIEHKMLGLNVKATATGRGFTPAVYRYFRDLKELWGGPEKYHLGHEADKPFGLLKPGEDSTIVAQSEKSNLRQAAKDKAKIEEAVAKGATKRGPKGEYPGAQKGVRYNKAKVPRVVGHKGVPVTSVKPSKPSTTVPKVTSTTVPKVTPTVPKAVPVRAPEQLSLNLGPPAKTPASTVVKTVTPMKPPTVTPVVTPAVTPTVTPAVNPAVTPAVKPTLTSSPTPTVNPTVPRTPVQPTGAVTPTLTSPPAATVSPTAAPKVTPAASKVVAGADDAAAAAKVEAATAKSVQTGGEAIKAVVPVVKGGTPVVKNTGALTRVVATGTKVLKPLAPVVKVAAPVVKAAAPVVKVIGKVAKPLGVAVAAYDMAKANNNSDRLVAAGDFTAGAAAYGGPVGLAFSASYTLTGLADQGVAAVSKATVGVDLSPSNIVSHGMNGADRLVSAVIPDSPDKPAYKNQNKVAWFLIDTLGF